MAHKEIIKFEKKHLLENKNFIVQKVPLHMNDINIDNTLVSNKYHIGKI